MPAHMLVVENDDHAFNHLLKVLSPFGCSPESFYRITLGQESLSQYDADGIIMSIAAGANESLVEQFNSIRQLVVSLPIIVFLEKENEEQAIQLFAMGAHAVFAKNAFTGMQLYGAISAAANIKKHAQQVVSFQAEYRHIFMKNGVPMVVINGDNKRILSANDSAAALYQYSHQELTTLCLQDLADPARVNGQVQPTDETAEHTGTVQYKKNGSLMYVEMTSTAITYMQRSHVIVAIKDLTDTVTAAREAAKSAQRLKAIFNATNDLILLTNDEGTVVKFNKAAAKKLGYHAAEMAALNIQDWYGEVPDLASPFTDKQIRKGLLKLKKKNDKYILCNYTFTPHILPGLHLSVFRDITRQEVEKTKRAEQSQNIENILNNISEGFYTLDKKWTITYWNKSAEKKVGLKKEQVVGKYLWDCFPEMNWQDYHHYYERVMANNSAVIFEEFYPPLNAWFSVSAYANKDGVAVFFSDITEAKKHAAEKLEARNNMAALINSSNNLIWSVDNEMKLLSFNEAYAERIKILTGKPAYEGLQLPGSFHNEETRNEWIAYYQRALAGENYTIENTSVNFGNVEKRAEITFYPFYGVNSDMIKGVACYSHDITQRVAARRMIEAQNEQLKEKEQSLGRLTNQLEKVMNSSLDVICSIDKRGHFLQVSKASFYVWGYEPEEMIGKHVLDFVHPQFSQFTYNVSLNVIRGSEYTDFQNVHIHKNGSSIPMLWSARWDKEERIMFCVARDASAMKEAEKLKNENEQRITALVEKGADVICILDETANCMYVSPNISKIFGYDEATLLGTNVLSIIHRDDLDKAVAELKRVPMEGEVSLAPFRCRNAYGEWRWIETVATNQLHNPAIKGIVISSRDITSRKQTEAEREHMIKELLKSNADLKQFSFITSHNLRAPLSNIVGILNIVDYDHLDTYNREMLGMLEKSVKQLTQTIDDLAKILIVKNNVNIEISSINLEETFTQVKSVFLNTLNDVCANVKTDFQVTEIPFNITYFESILVNLVSNAIKYRSSNRDLNITISSEYDAKQNVVLKFADNGIGIDLVRHKNKLFGLYQRFHDHIEGHGLGLFIIKSQIVALGGKIDIKSAVDEGTTFTITFKQKKLHQQLA